KAREDPVSRQGSELFRRQEVYPTFYLHRKYRNRTSIVRVQPANTEACNMGATQSVRQVYDEASILRQCGEGVMIDEGRELQPIFSGQVKRPLGRESLVWIKRNRELRRSLIVSCPQEYSGQPWSRRRPVLFKRGCSLRPDRVECVVSVPVNREA